MEEHHEERCKLRSHFSDWDFNINCNIADESFYRKET